MPWGGAGGQNIEHPHTLAILSSFVLLCILVLLARHSSGELCCLATALIGMTIEPCLKFYTVPIPVLDLRVRATDFEVCAKFLQCRFLQSLWWDWVVFGMSGYKIQKCFRKEMWDFRRAVLSGDRSSYVSVKILYKKKKKKNNNLFHF